MNGHCLCVPPLCQTARWFWTALAPSPPCPPLAGLTLSSAQLAPTHEGCHTGAPSVSPSMGFSKAVVTASEASQLREMGKNPHVFHMSLELKYLAFTVQEAAGISCYCK